MGSRRWTRKKVLLVLAVVAVVLLLALKFSPPRTLSMTWDYDYAHNPPCTAPSAGNCVSGFRVFVGELNHRSQQIFVSNRFDVGRSLVSQQLETNFEVNRFGYLQLCVVAVKNTQIGVTVESAPLCMKRLVLPFGIASSWTK